jgi:hypothetical protein
MRKKLFQYLCDLETLVFTLESLYADPETVKRMNQRAPRFFQQHQMLLIDKIFLELAKLFDPEKQGKNENFSLKHLMKLTPASVADASLLDLQWHKAKKALGNITTVRNKSICHNDCGLGHESISESLDTIKLSMIEAKKLFQMCCEPEHHRFTKDIYPARTLKQWLLSTDHPQSDLG